MTDQEAFEPNIHAAALLLPWYLNGTLSEEERSQVMRHLSGCGECQAELNELILLRTRMNDAYAMKFVPSPRVIETVMSRITRKETLEAPPSGFGRAWSAIQERIEGWFRTLFRPRWAPILATFVIVGQLGLLVWVAGKPPTPLAVATRSVSPVTSVRVRIIFHAAAQEHQIRAVLESLRGRIVDGPSREGAYLVELSAGNAAELAKKLAIIRGDADVVKEVSLSDVGEGGSLMP